MAATTPTTPSEKNLENVPGPGTPAAEPEGGEVAAPGKQPVEQSNVSYFGW